MSGEFRRDLAIDFLAGRIGVCGVEVRKNRVRTVEQLARAFHGHDGVFKSRFLGVRRNLSDLLQLLAHTGFDRRGEMFVLYFVERR